MKKFLEYMKPHFHIHTIRWLRTVGQIYANDIRMISDFIEGKVMNGVIIGQCGNDRKEL